MVPALYINTCLTLLCCLVVYVSGHAQTDERSEKQVAFEQMIADPASVDSVEAAFIYLYYIEELIHDDPDTGLVLYEQMAEFGKQIGNDDVIANGYASLAFLYKLQGDVTNQIKYGLKSLPYTGDPILLAHTLGDIGVGYLQQVQFDSARYYIDSAFVLGVALDSTWRSTFYMQKFQLLIRENKFHAALDILLRSIPFVPQDNVIRRAEIFVRFAQVYRQIGDLDKAIEYELKCLAISQDHNLSRTLATGNARLGELYYRKGLDSLAQVHFELAIPLAIKRKHESALLSAYSFLALLELKKGKTAAARRYVSKADSLFLLIPFKDNREDYYTARVRLFMAEGRFVEARHQLDNFLNYAHERNSKATKLKAYRELRALYTETENWRSANALADSIEDIQVYLTRADQKQLIYDLEAKYQTDLKNAEIARLKNETLINQLQIEKERRKIWALVGGLILALMAILGVAFAFRIKQRANQQLQRVNADLRKALDQNTMLMKEIHHRVKNNLQVVSSLLNLQGKFEKDAAVIQAINTGKERVHSISLLHKTLYDNQDLRSVRVRPYFTELIEHLVNSYLGPDNKLDLTQRIDNFLLDIDTLVPLGLIANELITNTFKYAFRENPEPALLFELTHEGSLITLAVRDNGPGLPINSLPRRSRSLGMQLIYSFAERLEADIRIENSDGCHVILQFESQHNSLQTRIA